LFVASVSRITWFDHTLADRRGLPVLLAIEDFRLRRGQLPDSLQQLVPEFIPSIPADPWVENGTLLYKRTDPAADEHRRSYILYFVGSDAVDDGGVGAPPGGTTGPNSKDFVINDPNR
jgi:hypothetical protein